MNAWGGLAQRNPPFTRSRRVTASPSPPYTSQLERLENRRVKQLLDRHQPRRQALRMVMAQKDLQRVAVRRDAVGPEVLAHQLAHRHQGLLHERQRHLGGGGVAQRRQRRALRLLESL